MFAEEDAEPLTLTGVVPAGAPHVAETKEEMMRITELAEKPVIVIPNFPQIVIVHAHTS
jgi:hypothetical protein